MFSKITRATLVKSLLWALLASALALGVLRSGATAAPTHAHAVRPARTTMRSRELVPAGRRQPIPVGNMPGWRQVFTDDFNGPKPDPAKWGLYAGKPGGDPAGWWDPRHVTVSHGMLVISAYSDPRDHNRWASGGLSSSPGLVQTYGKYLVRFRFDPGIGVGHAFLLMPANDSWPPEVDFSEDDGSGRIGTSVTLHHGKPDTRQFGWLGGVNLTQWHTIGVQWTPGKLQYTMDGRIWDTMAGHDVPALPMVLDMQTQTWPCSGAYGRCPNRSTPRVVRMYVDWVAAYAPSSATGG